VPHPGQFPRERGGPRSVYRASHPGSKQQTGKECILRGFLKSNEFCFRGGQPLGGILGGQVLRSGSLARALSSYASKPHTSRQNRLRYKYQKLQKMQWLIHFHRSGDTVSPRRSRKYRAVAERSHRPIEWRPNERRNALSPSTADSYIDRKMQKE